MNARNLSFNELKHEYTLVTDDGPVILPSVTQIARAVTGKDLSNIPPDVLKAATDRGNAIHADVEAGTLMTAEGQWIEKQIKREGASFERVDWHEIDGFKYAGTCDIAMAFEIDDIKSQAELDLLYWTIQLNLYKFMYLNIKNLAVLWVPKSGNYQKVPIAILSTEKMSEVIAAFQEGRVLPPDFLSTVSQPEAASLDLIVYKNNVGELTTNAKAILAAVKKQLANYKAENYSEHNIADAKRDKAELNAAAKKLNDKRLELEREFMKPFNEFKDTITETCTAIKTASGMIDTVVKEVEQREKDEKGKLITDFFESTKCELFTLDQIWNPSWLNKTTKIKDVQTEITTRIEKVKEDLVVLDRIGEPDAKAHYLTTLNLESAMAEADRIKANRERLAAMEKAKADEPVPIPAAPVEPPQPIHAEPMHLTIVEEKRESKGGDTEMLERTFWVQGTRNQLIALSDFMNENNIAFGKIEQTA